MGVHNLYGDNMCVVLPPETKDVSELREIPDNQEVFAHTKTDQSIMIDILEYVEEEDPQAIKCHLDEISSANNSTNTAVSLIERVPIETLQMSECESAYFLSSTQEVSKFNENAKNTINVHLALFRLPSFSTDILLSFNDPVDISPDSSSHGPVPVSAQPWTLDDFRNMIISLKILNPDFLG